MAPGRPLTPVAAHLPINMSNVNSKSVGSPLQHITDAYHCRHLGFQSQVSQLIQATTT